MSDLTIFVATFNRIDTLERGLAALERQRHPKRIVIVDNGSWHPAAVAYLDELENRHTVYRLPCIEDVPEDPGGVSHHGGHGMQAVQRNVSEAFRREWENEPRPRWYGMTDADVCLDGPRESLDIYMELAAEIGRAVGPHLKLNAHRNYPLRSAAIILNARVLFRERMSWWEDVPYSHDPIDSTFHLFPASAWFSRLEMNTVRVGPPWWATHTDWQIDVCAPTVENHAYILGCGEAASWGGRWIRGMFEAYLRSPEEAFLLLESERRIHNDYFYPGFILAWMLQYGHGCEMDLERSRAVLYDSFPDWSPCWEYEEHWEALLNEDGTCLEWYEPAF